MKNETINRLNSFCMILIVMTHSVITIDYIEEMSIDFFYLLIFRTFTRIAVPTFFIISGYLLFQQYSIKKIKKRTTTILIPYLLWSLITLAIFIVFKAIPYTSHLINTNFQLSWTSIFNSIFIHPINGALWFLRDLYILVIMSPIFYYLMERKITAKIILFITAILWIFDLQYTFLVEPTFFFLIGSYLSISHKKLTIVKRRTKTIYSIFISYMLLICILTFIFVTKSWNPIILSKISVTTGLFVLFFNLQLLFSKNSIINHCLDAFKSYSFFVYASHLIVVQFIRKVIIIIFEPNNILLTIISYIITLILTISICCIGQNVLKKISPKFLNILTGSRC